MSGERAYALLGTARPGVAWTATVAFCLVLTVAGLAATVYTQKRLAALESATTAALRASLVGTACECPTNATRFGPWCVYVSDDVDSWINASRICRDDIGMPLWTRWDAYTAPSGPLVIGMTEVLRNESTARSKYWVGASRNDQGGWMWVDRTLLDARPEGRWGSFTTEKKDRGVALNSDGKMTLMRKTTELFYICGSRCVY